MRRVCGKCMRLPHFDQRHMIRTTHAQGTAEHHDMLLNTCSMRIGVALRVRLKLHDIGFDALRTQLRVDQFRHNLIRPRA